MDPHLYTRQDLKRGFALIYRTSLPPNRYLESRTEVSPSFAPSGKTREHQIVLTWAYGKGFRPGNFEYRRVLIEDHFVKGDLVHVEDVCELVVSLRGKHLPENMSVVMFTRPASPFEQSTRYVSWMWNMATLEYGYPCDTADVAREENRRRPGRRYAMWRLTDEPVWAILEAVKGKTLQRREEEFLCSG